MKNQQPIIVKPTTTEIGQLATMTVEQLKTLFVEQQRRTAESLKLMAEIWVELERRGVDLSEFRRSIGDHVPKIAGGRLAPEAVIAFSGKPLILKAIEGLPLERQRELASGGKIKVYDPRTEEEVEANLMQLGADSVMRAFRGGEEVPVDVQATNIRKTARNRPKTRHYRVVIDRSERTVTIGKSSVTIDELMAALIESGGFRRIQFDAVKTAEGGGQVVVFLTADENERLAAMAKAKSISALEIARQAVLAYLV